MSKCTVSLMLYNNLLPSFLFFLWYGDHQDLHVLTHSFPTRRSSYLPSEGWGLAIAIRALATRDPSLRWDDDDAAHLRHFRAHGRPLASSSASICCCCSRRCHGISS